MRDCLFQFLWNLFLSTPISQRYFEDMAKLVIARPAKPGPAEAGEGDLM
ncbi:MAG: hypothetical protein JSW56_19145 [Deltaproteobacteria bacterium]|nr:MAG: hypothetical protein JSW56_19145 [Deltaproteobacteria bacterium]